MSSSYDITEFWRVETDSDVIPADFHTSQQPAVPRGESDERTLLFTQRHANHARSHTERHGSILGFREYAGSFALEVDFDNVPVYTEQHPRESLLVALRPPDALDTGRGVWGLVGDVTDETNVPQTRWALTLSLTYIASLDEYSSHAAVRDAHERRGFH